MTQALNEEEREILKQRLYELKLEHRDMDMVVRRLLEDPHPEEMQLKRFKKRKLNLKEKIAKINDRLIPDMEA